MKFSTVIALFAVLILSTSAFAEIQNCTFEPDGDDVFTMLESPLTLPDLTLIEGEYGLTVVGSLHEVTGEGITGHLIGTIGTDTPEDPTIKVFNSITNEDTFSWTGMIVNVSIGGTGELFPPAIPPSIGTLVPIVVPGDWGIPTIVQPAWDGTKYVGSLTYAAGTPIAVGDDLEFNYKISFSGATQYQFCQEMTPVPEPTTITLLILGLIGLAAFKLRK